MSGRRSDAGFTLTEMLIVLVLFAIVVSMSLPFARQSGETQEFVAKTQAVAAVLRNARMLALSSNRAAEVGLDLETLTVSGPIGKPVKLPDGTEIEVTTDRTQINRETGGFRFYPDGGSTGGRIILRWRHETREVNINWLTGAILVTSGRREP